MAVTTIPKGKQITGTERDQLAADLKAHYAQGFSIRVLAASLGRSYGFVHRLLSEAGVQLRTRGGNTTGRRP